jgi:hypothetical protein
LCGGILGRDTSLLPRRPLIEESIPTNRPSRAVPAARVKDCRKNATDDQNPSGKFWAPVTKIGFKPTRKFEETQNPSGEFWVPSKNAEKNS